MEKILNQVTYFRNADRYLKCASCRATAAFVLTATGVTVTATYPPVVAGHGLKDDVVVKPWTTATCQRHVKINVTRAREAQSRTVDKRPV